MKEIIIAEDSGKLNEIAAEKFVSMARKAIAENARFAVALAGGSTPKSLYQLLASEKFRGQIDWRKTFFFFGDERDVLPDDGESNFRMANENLLKPLGIPAENVFRWQTELGDAPEIAENYQQTIRKFFDLKNSSSAGADRFDRLQFPRFDLILLGMGDDGHTASLFPFSAALRETAKIAVANYVEKLDTNRLTLTFSAINNAANVVFLVVGAAKANVLKEVLEGESAPEKFPSQMVNPQNGDLYWFVDAPAARILR